MTKGEKKSLFEIAAHHENEVKYYGSVIRINWRSDCEAMRRSRRAIASMHRKWAKVIRSVLSKEEQP